LRKRREARREPSGLKPGSGGGTESPAPPGTSCTPPVSPSAGVAVGPPGAQGADAIGGRRVLGEPGWAEMNGAGIWPTRLRHEHVEKVKPPPKENTCQSSESLADNHLRFHMWFPGGKQSIACIRSFTPVLYSVPCHSGRQSFAFPCIISGGKAVDSFHSLVLSRAVQCPLPLWQTIIPNSSSSQTQPHPKLNLTPNSTSSQPHPTAPQHQPRPNINLDLTPAPQIQQLPPRPRISPRPTGSARR
jgi:hypothetical protein